MQSVPKPETLTTEELRIDAANWLRMEELYHLLDKTPLEDQTSVLDEATNDPILRARMLSLLAASTDLDSAGTDQSGPIVPGMRIGPYSVLRFLGSGGLGSVYLVERLIGGAVQQCALKVLSTRTADLGFRTRFAREQQILATLDHPNVTHLLDAGISERDEPYLVMEFVDGVDLTQYCDQGRLSVRRRLELFLTICEAVTYAHRKLVVHLDLKPSNVLVTAEGNVKLLDFGTSKLIQKDASLITTIMATPAYASPEQLRGEPISTSCDVYSLGVMLYELLAGLRPFEMESAAMAMQRAMTGQEPARLTSAVTAAAAELRGLPGERLKRLLRGDLASIVARCLRSRPQDRYSSVEALAEDLRRYLAGMPVLARRQTARYRLARFVRRHRIGLSIATLVLMSISGEGVYAYKRQQQALEQGRRAEQMQIFLSQLIRLANEQQMGKPAATVTDFLDLGVRVLPDMIKNPDDRRAAALSLGESMFDSRDFVQALPVLEGVAMSAHAAHDSQTEVEARAFAGLTAFSIGNMKVADLMTNEGLGMAHDKGVGRSARIWIEAAWAQTHAPRGIDLAKSVTLFTDAVNESRNGDVSDREKLWVLENFATTEQIHGRLVHASELTDQAYKIVGRQPYALCDYAFVLNSQANLITLRGDDLGSLPVYRQAISAASACSGAESTYTLLITAFFSRALINVGQNEEAISVLNKSMPAWHQSGDDVDMARAMIYLSRAYLMQGKYERAESVAREALQVQEGKVAPASTRFAICHLLIAQSLAYRAFYHDALTEAKLSNDIYDRVSGMSKIEEFYHAQAQSLRRDLQEKKAPQPIPLTARN